ncbi:gram-negative bacterial tonB protein [mine drainage metagenome]|uniref:Gram-negative bacterial tonB protein n=1 Tax=mine drainage metagenome TaxID=410659 RepID=A0A1J5SWI4_9ZZZZ
MLLNPNMNISLMVNALAPMRASGLAVDNQQTTSYVTLVLVVAVHLFGFAWLINNKVVQPVVKESMSPMIVSFVASVATQMTVAKESTVPILKKIAIKKQPQVVSAKLPIAELVPVESTKQESLDKDSTQQTSIEAAKTSEFVEEVKQKVEAEAEAVIEPPRFGAAYLNNPAPEYPSLSRRFGEQGRVLLRVLVSISGNAENVQIESSSGFVRLDQAAIQAVKGWRFIPAKKNSQPISAYVLVPVKFSLDG